MKYLKSYKILEELNIKDDDIQNLKDMLLELNDIGYITNIRETVNCLNIVIDLPKKSRVGTPNIPLEQSFNFEDIKECVLRIKDYSGDRYVSSDVKYDYGNHWKRIKLQEDTVIKYPLHSFIMWIKYIDSKWEPLEF